MNKNQKIFNAYVFTSTFARNLIEIFIPLLLFKFGYSFKMVIIYYLINCVVSLLLTYPSFLLAKKYNNKVLAFIGIIAFVLLQISLMKMTYSIYYLLLVASLFAIYRRGYWISRRYYNLKIVSKDNIAKTYSIIMIVNQIGVIVAGYIGSLVLDYVSVNILTIIAIIIFCISVVFLFLLDFKHEKNKIKLDFFKTLKSIPKRDLFLFGSYESMNIIKLLFTLYVFMYVKNTYQTVGILNLLTNASNILFAYFYGKKINNDKNYLKLSILLVVTIFIFKVNTTTSIIAFISFLEGIATKMYEISIGKEFYQLSKKYEYYNYNLVYEFTQNAFRLGLSVLILFLTIDIHIMIYVLLLIMSLGIFINFKETKKTYFHEKDLK